MDPDKKKRLFELMREYGNLSWVAGGFGLVGDPTVSKAYAEIVALLDEPDPHPTTWGSLKKRGPRPVPRYETWKDYEDSKETPPYCEVFGMCGSCESPTCIKKRKVTKVTYQDITTPLKDYVAGFKAAKENPPTFTPATDEEVSELRLRFKFREKTWFEKWMEYAGIR